MAAKGVGMTLLVEHLSGRARGGDLAHRVSLEVAPGEGLTLIGPRGSGASLLLRLISGEARPTSGRILLGGVDIGAWPAHQRPLQRLRLDTPLPARRTLAEVDGLASREGLLDLLGLSGLEHQPLRRLDRELRPQAALALALAAHPQALLLDEPGLALDPPARSALYGLLDAVREALNLVVLVATHEPEVAFALEGRVGVMQSGRLLEVGSARELYLRPQTDVTATALGPVNLLLGQVDDEGVRAGPFVFATHPAGGLPGVRPRVQVMFRPDDVELSRIEGGLTGTALGVAEVTRVRFSGAGEQVLARLPPIPGVRPLAPAPRFGEPGVLIEARRSTAAAHQLPLGPGARVWVGVRRFHALPHLGLHIAALAGTSEIGLRLASVTRARLSLLEPGDEPATTAVARLHRQQPCDLVLIPACAPGALDLAFRLLEQGSQHVLMIDELREPPRRGLVCVAGHEGDKATAQFAGRLLRHSGAAITLLTVLGPRAPVPERVQRFHAAARETLAVLGVPADSLIRHGEPAAEILAALGQGSYDLVVMGAPVLHRRDLGAVGAIARQIAPAPLLIVRPPGLVPPELNAGLMRGLLAEADL